jgi:cytochrome c peroxidase
MINDDNVVSAFLRETPDSATQLYRNILARLVRTESSAINILADRLEKPVKEIIFFDVARAIAAFIRSEFRLRETKFQNFVFGKASLSADELQGGLIFYGKGKCVNCHTGSHFSDFKFHAVPFPQIGFGKNGFGVDYGRFNVTFRPEDLYRFRTPPLFNVAATGPYGHAGSLRSLKDAIVAHFDPLRLVDPKLMEPLERHEYFKRMSATGETFRFLSMLNEQEVAQVEQFLKSLSFGPANK